MDRQGEEWQARRGQAWQGEAWRGVAGMEKASMKFETKTGKDYFPFGIPARLMQALVDAGGEAQAVTLAKACGLEYIGNHLRSAVRNGSVLQSHRGQRTFFKLGGGMQGVRKVFVTFKGTPRCTTPEEYALWRAAGMHAHPLKHLGFCEDCSAEYQTEMKLQERCENPSVWFQNGHAGIGPK